MIRDEKFPQGAPAWVDLQSPDPGASKAFYSKLFGWSYRDNAMSADYTYSMVISHDATVAGIAPQAPEAVEAGIPTSWTTYFAVDDMEAVLARVAPAGGRIIMGADTVEDFGRMALIEDSIGAPIALWQADALTGAAAINEPGAVVWHELAAGNWEHAVPFYLDVFGIETHRESVGGDDYTMLRVDGQYVAGFRDPEDEDEGRTPHWDVYFNVADADGTVASAEQLGATILTGAYDIEGLGRMALLRDPQGADFWILQDAAKTGS